MANVTINQFKQLDIRIGTVVNAEVPKWSHWVIKLSVDIGLTGVDPSTPESDSVRSGRQKNTIVVFAGLLGFYKPEDLVGKQFPFIVNLEPKKIGPEGDYSQGMMLAGVEKLDKPVKVLDDETDEKPVLLSPSGKVVNGTKVR
ncbi:MAG: hypothetical protein US53_C0021G0009 [Candidatus Woesebacteria bacterium GW2011_GWA1_37_7]|uniref:tRNA-binding domain-containing protein n=2 Tax=Candidatus Woeseibacteriota TaxID=1752722 RepID=A0A0G0H240_9BACT|nr:MAG: hypothetical protein US53_C0021G0009 [Candidatus Woesebacteria bacterium GW2011_GWA1_37_7]OGM18165.1 MAG: hypothetical protein A2685_00540 [Candidatus Woesebacteria bacterium RIFCSPHIGHO2_01_FULL_37_10]